MSKRALSESPKIVKKLMTLAPTTEGLKIVSFNVAGIRAAQKKGFNSYVDTEKADILCVQETKLNGPGDFLPISDYPFQYYSHCEVKKGYSGTAVFSKIEPISVNYKIGGEDVELDREGRYITLEYEVAAYVINAGTKLERLERKRAHYKDLTLYLESLKKPIIFGGDLNVAHHEIDLARPKTNAKTPGFTPGEREDFTNLIEKLDLVDSYRLKFPEVVDRYTYYSYRFGCRAKNLGWRLDYFLVSSSLVGRVLEADIRSDSYGTIQCFIGRPFRPLPYLASTG